MNTTLIIKEIFEKMRPNRPIFMPLALNLFNEN